MANLGIDWIALLICRFKCHMSLVHFPVLHVIFDGTVKGFVHFRLGSNVIDDNGLRLCLGIIRIFHL